MGEHDCGNGAAHDVAASRAKRHSARPRIGRPLLRRSGDEISGDAGDRSPSESARRSFLPSAKRVRADPPGDTSEVA
jgi:hypothetical protein